MASGFNIHTVDVASAYHIKSALSGVIPLDTLLGLNALPFDSFPADIPQLARKPILFTSLINAALQTGNNDIFIFSADEVGIPAPTPYVIPSVFFDAARIIPVPGADLIMTVSEYLNGRRKIVIVDD